MANLINKELPFVCEMGSDVMTIDDRGNGLPDWWWGDRVC